MSDLPVQVPLGETWPPWERLIEAIQNYLAIEMTEEGLRKLRHAFTAVGEKNQEDFVSAVFLEALEARAKAGNLAETDLIRAAWRVGKRIYREAARTLAVAPSILDQASQGATSIAGQSQKPNLEAAELLEFAKQLDPVGAALLVMWLDGETLSEIATRSGLPTTTVWERLKRVKTELKKRFGHARSP